MYFYVSQYQNGKVNGTVGSKTEPNGKEEKICEKPMQQENRAYKSK